MLKNVYDPQQRAFQNNFIAATEKTRGAPWNWRKEWSGRQSKYKQKIKREH